MSDAIQSVPEDIREELIRSFEAMGSAVFQIGEDRDLYETLMAYVAKYRIYTTTDVDEDSQTIVVTRRPTGSMELG